MTLTCKNSISYSAEHSGKEMFEEKVWFTIILVEEIIPVIPIRVLAHSVYTRTTKSLLLPQRIY